MTATSNPKPRRPSAGKTTREPIKLRVVIDRDEAIDL
jgi:hypothetical protein